MTFKLQYLDSENNWYDIDVSSNIVDISSRLFGVFMPTIGKYRITCDGYIMTEFEVTYKP